jgi:serine/threonine-protein kinase
MRFCPRCGTRFLAGEPFCPHDGSATQELPDEPQVDALPGTVVDGRYRIDKRIGEGGMGIVYSATHAMLGKKLALKVLRGEVARDPDVVQRFITEAQSATSIGHENIIDISDFGRLPDRTVYFVMEYLDGEALTKLIRRGGSIPVREAVHIIRQIASALGAAHTRGIVHRDLKPDNIYLIKRGGAATANFVKVLDFGIAKVGGASSKLTKTGMVFGTPHYMSPEQAAGQTVDQRTDIYALGVIMYEMFVGKVPFDADTFMGILTKHMFEPPIPPSQASTGGNRLGALEDITLKALQKKPEQRYQSMADLLADLDRVASGGQVAIGMQGGAAVPDNLADALEPPSRTEMRLSTPSPPFVHRPMASSTAAESEPRKRGVPLVLLGAAALLVVGVVVGGAAFLLARNGFFGGSPQVATSTPAGDTPPGAAAVAPSAFTGASLPGMTTQPVAVVPAPVVPSPVGAVAMPNPPPGSGLPIGAGGPIAPPTPIPPALVPQPPGAAPADLLWIESAPAGAEVYQGGALIGNTPLQHARPIGAVQVSLEVHAPGHRAQEVRLSAMSPPRLSVQLERTATASAPRTPRTTGGGSTAPRPNPRGDRGTSDLTDPWGP